MCGGNKFVASQSLLERTIMLVKTSKLSTYKLALATDIPYDWLVKLKAGKIKDPSVNRIQAVYETLTGVTLFADEDGND